MCSGSIFDSQIKFFSRYYDCFAPDLKGFGGNKMEYPYSLDDYIADVREYMYKNGLESPDVIAHSFGGRITLKMCYQKEFGKIVLTGSAGLKPKRKIKYYVKKGVFNVLKTFVPRGKLGAFYSKEYNALNGVMKESYKKIVSEHLDYTLKGIENKTLIIFGEDDKETPIYMAKKLNREIANSRLVILKGAGHFCFLEKPNAFNMEVREFLLP